MQSRGWTRVLVVTDPGVVAAGLLSSILEPLRSGGIEVEVFSSISSNPTEAEVNAGAAAYNRAGADVVVALGGGAAMDVGKLVAVRVSTQLPFEKLDDARGGERYIPQDIPSTIAVPTTAGTGSEVGRAAVLTVESTGAKTVVFAPQMLPAVAILDPALTQSLPPGPTAATGFDALSHCIEAYLAKGDHPMADSIALGGIRLIAEHLETAVHRGMDLPARGALMKAAMMGAVAFQKGLGACHSMSHPLGAELNVHHGLANALCLPAVVDFNERAVAQRVADVGAILGAESGEGGCARRLQALSQRCGLPSGLSSQGVTEQHIERLSMLALADGCHQANPRVCSEQDFRDLFRTCL